MITPGEGEKPFSLDLSDADFAPETGTATIHSAGLLAFKSGLVAKDGISQTRQFNLEAAVAEPDAALNLQFPIIDK